jgi:ABC-type Zn2+ transport system substrate-binding protein/surface adhesin
MKIECDCVELKNQYHGKQSTESLHKKIEKEQIEKKKLIKPDTVFKNYKKGKNDKKIKTRLPKSANKPRPVFDDAFPRPPELKFFS